MTTSKSIDLSMGLLMDLLMDLTAGQGTDHKQSLCQHHPWDPCEPAATSTRSSTSVLSSSSSLSYATPPSPGFRTGMQRSIALRFAVGIALCTHLHFDLGGVSDCHRAGVERRVGFSLGFPFTFLHFGVIFGEKISF